MKTIFTLLFIIPGLILNAQQLNRYGHFMDAQQQPAYDLQLNNDGGSLIINNTVLKGSSVFEINSGYLTVTGNYENAPSVLRIYNISGKEIFEKTFLQTINLKLSSNKLYCAFYDLKNINVVNLVNHEVTLVKGSAVFDIDNNGNVVAYDEATSTVHYSHLALKINEPVYNILFFKNEPLIATYKSIYKIEKGTFQKCFTTTSGRIFETKVIANQLCISTKTEFKNEFVFQSYSSNDLLNFTKRDSIPLALMRQQKITNNEPTSKMPTGELIQDPLYYYDDTVYQPIGNSYAEIQEYSAGAPYLHPGVDLLGYNQQPVYAVKKGYVKAVLTTSSTYHWRIAIANENTANATTGYLYAHLDELTIPYTVGDSVDEGDVVGLLVDFPVTGFVHCHFARITDAGATWSGGWWTYDNPLSYMTNLFDTIAPTFEKTIGTDAFAFRDAAGNYLSADSLFDEVKVISKVYDQVNASWHVDVNKLRYNMSPLASPQTILFDTLAYEYNFYTDVYPAGTYNLDVLNTIYSRDVTCFSAGDYNLRDFFHIVTNSDGNDTIDSNDSIRMFDTKAFQNGSYIFRVIASDPSGNTNADSMIIQIKNSTAAVNEFAISDFHIAPNPSSNGIFRITTNYLKTYHYEVYSILNDKIMEGSLSGSHFTIDLSGCHNGLYFLKLKNAYGNYDVRLLKL